MSHKLAEDAEQALASKPVFIIGHGSSGTSILATLLREKLGIAFGTESQFVVHYHRRLQQYGDLGNEQNLRKLVEHLLEERWFARSAKFGFRTSTADILKRVTDRTYSGVLDAIFSEFADQLGMTRWGDKTPAYNHDLDVIDHLFPNAQYIHMVRDGRDVAVSVFRRYWGHKNIYMAATDWRDEIELVDRFISGLPEDRHLEVRYEDLLCEPVATMRRLSQFLAVKDPDGSLMAAVEKTVPLELNRTNFDKWRREWPERYRLKYEQIACEQLRRHHYETMVDVPSPECAWPVKAFWYVHNKTKKWTYREYWADNAYKARLRLRDFLRQLGRQKKLPYRLT